jgi:glucokinase
MPALAGDIGGTKTSVAIVDIGPRFFQPKRSLPERAV